MIIDEYKKSVQYKNDAYGIIGTPRILPKGYTQVDYIESDGKTWINTEHFSTNKTRFIVDIQIPLSSFEDYGFFGVFASENAINNRVVVNKWNNKDVYYVFGTTQSKIDGITLDTKRTKIENGVNGLYIGDTQIVNYPALPDGTSSLKDYLFTANTNTGTPRGTKCKGMRLFSCQIMDNDIMTRNFIPCFRNSDNAVGLYDLVSQQFFENSGTGAFTYGSIIDAKPNQKNLASSIKAYTEESYNMVEEKGGSILNPVAHNLPDEYQEVDYIKGDGESYIDTGLKQTSKTKIEFEFTSNKINGTPYEILFGTYLGAENKAFKFGEYIGANMNIGVYLPWAINKTMYGLKSDGTFTTATSDATITDENQKHKYIFDLPKKTIQYDELICKSISTFPVESVDYSTYIFNRNERGIPNSTSGSKGSMYNWKWYENDVLMQDLIPCYIKATKEVGMYDLVSQQFFGNQGTGAFTYGTEIPKYIDKNLENLSRAISTIPDDEWHPQPDWWDIDKILEEDTEEYPAKMIVLLSDNNNTSEIKTRNADKIVTSDGGIYDNIPNTNRQQTQAKNISHNWDKTKDKVCSLGYKTRYIIYYYSENVNIHVGGIVTDGLLYVIFKNFSNIYNGARDDTNMFYSQKLLESVKFIESTYSDNLTISSPNFENIDNIKFGSGNFSVNFAGTGIKKIPKEFSKGNILFGDQSLTNCYFLEELPSINITTGARLMFVNAKALIRLPFIDSHNQTNFTSYCGNADRLKIIENLDFYSATNFPQLPNNLFEIKEVKNLKLSGLNLTNNKYLNHDTLIRILNALYDYSDSSSVYTLTLGATNLAKLTEEEKAIATDKGWTLA